MSIGSEITGIIELTTFVDDIPTAITVFNSNESQIVYIIIEYLKDTMKSEALTLLKRQKKECGIYYL